MIVVVDSSGVIRAFVVTSLVSFLLRGPSLEVLGVFLSDVRDAG